VTGPCFSVVFYLSCALLVAYLRPCHMLPVAPARGDYATIEIPFRYEPPLMPFIVVQACINGQPPMPFLVDTGVSAGLVIDTLAARKLQLRPNRMRVRVNSSVELTGTDISSLALMGANGEQLECAQTSAFLLDLKLLDSTYSGPRIAGIIGAPLLSLYAVRLDFTRRLLTVYTAGTPPVPAADAAIVSMRGRTDGYNVLVSPQKGMTVRMVVDTGALNSTVPVSVVEYLRPTATTTGCYRQVGFSMMGDRWRLPRVQIGNLAETDVPLAAAPSFTYAALGLDLLSRFRVTLDFPHGKLMLERDPAAEGRPHLRGWMGIGLEEAGKGFRVAALAPESPAALAGVERGVEVVAVDGQQLEGLPLTVAEEMLNGWADTPASLTVRRGGRIQTISLTRASEFAVQGPLVGAILQKPDGAPWLVLWVAAGSACEQAGLAAHDEVIAVNGATAESLTPEAAWEQLRLPRISLRVRRRGQPQPRIVTLLDPRYAHVH
jgi:predicted aspartyl protease